MNEATWLRNKELDFIFRNTTFTIAGRFLALLTSASTPTAIGTEVTGGSYARQDIGSSFGVAASSGVITNTVAVTYTNLPACTITHYAVLDHLTASSNLLVVGALVVPVTVGGGATHTFAAGDIQFAKQ